MNVSIVGHRPDKLWGYKVFGESQREIKEPYNFLYEEIRKQLKRVILDNSLEPISVLSGMDIGVQQLGMLAAVNIAQDKTIETRVRYMIKTVAIMPCIYCEAKWPANVKKIYQGILDKVDYVKQSNFVYEDYGEVAYQMRDDEIINKSDVVIGVYNDVEKSRTLHALRYAAIKGKRIIKINPNLVKIKAENNIKFTMSNIPRIKF